MPLRIDKGIARTTLSRRYGGEYNPSFAINQTRRLSLLDEIAISKDGHNRFWVSFFTTKYGTVLLIKKLKLGILSSGLRADHESLADPILENVRTKLARRIAQCFRGSYPVTKARKEWIRR